MTCPSWQDLVSARFEDSESGRRGTASDSALSHIASGCIECTRRWHLLDVVEPMLPSVVERLDPHRMAELAVGTGNGGAMRATAGSTRIAEILHDSSRSAPELALRSTSTTSRHVLCSAGPYSIDLVSTERGSLVGNLVPFGEFHDGVCLLVGEDDVREAPLESNGDFLFEGLKAGRYTLILEGQGESVVVEDLQLSGLADDT